MANSAFGPEQPIHKIYQQVETYVPGFPTEERSAKRGRIEAEIHRPTLPLGLQISPWFPGGLGSAKLRTSPQPKSLEMDYAGLQFNYDVSEYLSLQATAN